MKKIFQISIHRIVRLVLDYRDFIGAILNLHFKMVQQPQTLFWS